MKRTAYPILRKLTAEEAESIIRQSEAGIALTAEQLERLGLYTGLKGLVLLPADAALMTDAQLRAMFPNAERLEAAS